MKRIESVNGYGKGFQGTREHKGRKLEKRNASEQIRYAFPVSMAQALFVDPGPHRVVKSRLDMSGSFQMVGLGFRSSANSWARQIEVSR